ncbi:MAG: hypothetical protein H0U98_12115 [Alphaproteobacteria bacterium]|nr:hypothetical protein [Alphaproteobacteria bacterium]
MKRAALAAALLMGACANASAQPAPVPGTQPAAEIENFPHVDISNGILSARVFPPGKGELNQGSRFDHAGVVFHITYKGQDYNSYWFDRFVTDPMDNGKYPPATEHSCCNMSGPVEEFSAVGFDEAGMGGRFLKPGIGIFKRTSDRYDQFPTLPVLNEGTRIFQSSKTGARFTQDLKDPESGYGYRYSKSVQLVPGKPQMIISHVMTNTGSKPIVTEVFCHNFLTINPGSENLVITAPFAWSAVEPFQPELVKLDGNTIRYLAPIPKGVTTQSLLTGFGDKVSDYDFTITDTKTGFGQRIRADAPPSKINMWSIAATYSLEPYVAISLKPGETKRWTYTYDFYGPGEKP